MDTDKIKRLGRAVIETEREALAGLIERIDESFVAACGILEACKGRIVVTGMGKSGHIGGKIAATLASTGSPAFFVHPGEASHGDLGMITRQDVVLALSNSGETGEILTLLPIIKRLHVPMVALTGRPDSTLATTADVHINVAVDKEACPLNLAPTASSTAALAMGDALAITLLEWRGFTEEDFARSHPGGSLGRRLLVHVQDLMHTGDEIPRVTSGTPLAQALLEITGKGMGMTAVVDAEDRLLGVYTDGDLRRTLDRNLDIHSTAIDEVMTAGCKTVEAGQLAVEAVELMQRHAITALLVADESNRVVGALHMHDLLRAGVI